MSNPMRLDEIRKRLEECETEDGARRFDAHAHLDIAYLLALDNYRLAKIAVLEAQLADALKVTTAATINHVATKPR
jgi:hypothetical protein